MASQEEGMAAEVGLGVIGGSGLYQMDAIGDGEWVSVETPFGDPSDAYFVGRLGGGARCSFFPATAGGTGSRPPALWVARPGAPAPRRGPGRRRPRKRRYGPRRGHLRLYGGPPVLHEGRVPPVSELGRGRDRNDEPPGSQAGPRGGDLFRHARPGDRLRLLEQRRGGRGHRGRAGG